MVLTFFGAAQTVTGSRFLLEYHNKRILFDCGLFQGPKNQRLLNWVPFTEAKKIDFVVLTHAHIDHSGYLPRLVKEGFMGRIITTESTRSLCEILLPDSGRLQEEDARFANETRHSKHDPALPLYTEKDAFDSLKYFQSRPSDEWFEIFSGMSIRFLRAGHILGSCIVQASVSENSKQHIVTFSGDLGNGRSVILRDPAPVLETDTLILEGTYGDRVQPKKDPCESIASIIEKVLSRGGTLVIPAFALGRTQEIIYLINKLESMGRIKKYPVYLDSPMADLVTQVYSKINGDLKIERIPGEDLQFSTAQFHVISKPDDSMVLCLDPRPKIVISAAGMLTGGRVLHHLKTQLPRPESGVLFVGYQAEGTKGLLLKNGFKSLRIHHREISVEAEIFSIDHLSAHADSNDLVQWVQKINRKPDKVFLVHGESNALSTLKYRIQNECKIDSIIIPQMGEFFEI